MSVSIIRISVCWGRSVLFPLSLWAADAGPSAMLHSKGGVWISSSESPESTAIFSGDSLETKSGSVANLDTGGSSVLIQPECLLKFDGDSLTLEHGSVLVTTSKVHERARKVHQGRSRFERVDAIPGHRSKWNRSSIRDQE
jgi:hypothetical protein